MKPLTLSIAAVERDTGLSKDTLRVWERRYGFPLPQRDTQGERAYSLPEIEKLRLIKRLLDAGHRPGRVVPMPIESLRALCEGLAHVPAPRAAGDHPEHAPQPLLDLLIAHDADALRRHLAHALLRLGLTRFLTEVASPLSRQVAEAWMCGQLAVYQEHLCSEVIQSVLEGALSSLPAARVTDQPRVLLTTLPGEPQRLGLVMLQALLAQEGARVLSLGVQTPLWDVVLAAEAHACDVVVLAFADTMTSQEVGESLAELQAKLPVHLEVWVGGATAALARRHLPDRVYVAELGQIPSRVQQWRERHGEGSAGDA